MEGLSYAEIGEQLGCRELHARVLFYRAKTSLRNRLAGQGYTQESLITALALFGLATSQAKSLSSSVIMASMNVGSLALFLGFVWSRWFWAAAGMVTATIAAFSLDQMAIGMLILVTLGISFVVGLFMEL